MTIRLIAFVMLASLASGATARNIEPITNYVDMPINTPLTPAQVRDTIVATAGAIRNRPWSMVETAPGRMTGRLIVRRAQAVVDVTYSAGQYSIVYRDSTRLNHNAGDGTINTAYNVWVRELANHLELAFNGPSAAMTNPAVQAGSPMSPVELSFWESVRDSNDPAELKAYLDQYPEGRFAPFARSRMATLGVSARLASTQTESTGAGPPQPGDVWTYRLSYPRVRGEFGYYPDRKPRIFVAEVTSVSDSEIVDQLSIDGSARPATKHGKGGYLIEQGVSVFSPYLAAFVNDLSRQTRLDAVNILESDCAMKYFCEAKARVTGTETISVPAGNFRAIRVVVEESWRSGAGFGDTRQAGLMNGGRTLTVWYVPQLKRAVKYASRRTIGDLPPTEPTFDLELVSYRVK